MKCDKCGIIVDGGYRKLVQHKQECHSYWFNSNTPKSDDSLLNYSSRVTINTAEGPTKGKVTLLNYQSFCEFSLSIMLEP